MLIVSNPSTLTFPFHFSALPTLAHFHWEYAVSRSSNQKQTQFSPKIPSNMESNNQDITFLDLSLSSLAQRTQNFGVISISAQLEIYGVFSF